MHRYFLKYKNANKVRTILCGSSETTNYVCSDNLNIFNRSYVAMCFNRKLKQNINI